MRDAMQDAYEMMDAINRKDEGKLRALLTGGYDINQSVKESITFTALHFAALNDYETGCRLLLEAGADPNHCGPDSWPPLVNAAGSASVDVCRLFLSAGADIHAGCNKTGDTALHRAALNGNVAACQLLLAAGAQVDASNGNGETPLHAVPVPLTLSSEVAAVLLGAGADPNAEDHSGRTPLGVTSCGRTAKLLMEAGADPFRSPVANIENPLTPLQAAIRCKRAEVVGAILDHGDVDLAQRTENGRTLIQLAGKDAAMRQLLMAAKTARQVEQGIGANDGALDPSRRSGGMVAL